MQHFCCCVSWKEEPHTEEGTQSAVTAARYRLTAKPGFRAITGERTGRTKCLYDPPDLTTTLTAFSSGKATRFFRTAYMRLAKPDANL